MTISKMLYTRHNTATPRRISILALALRHQVIKVPHFDIAISASRHKEEPLPASAPLTPPRPHDEGLHRALVCRQRDDGLPRLAVGDRDIALDAAGDELRARGGVE